MSPSENETTKHLVELKSWQIKQSIFFFSFFISSTYNKYLKHRLWFNGLSCPLDSCRELGFYVLVQRICYTSKVRQRHFSPWLLSNRMLRDQQCRRTVMRGERCWARVEVSWTGCFLLHGCSIALIRQGTSQVQIQFWQRARRTCRRWKRIASVRTVTVQACAVCVQIHVWWCNLGHTRFVKRLADQCLFRVCQLQNEAVNSRQFVEHKDWLCPKGAKSDFTECESNWTRLRLRLHVKTRHCSYLKCVN